MLVSSSGFKNVWQKEASGGNSPTVSGWYPVGIVFFNTMVNTN